MGEYANGPKGERIKLGTCENLFYVTRHDLETLIAAGWTGDDCGLDSYLRTRAFRCALPRVYDVPGDVSTISDRKPDFHHRYRINLGAEVMAMLSDVEHGAMYFHKNGTNFKLLCPHAGHGAPLAFSPLDYSIDLVAEGMGDGRAIYQCPYCGAMFNLCGHPAQAAVELAFRERWTLGDSKLPERVAAELLRMIAVREPVAASL